MSQILIWLADFIARVFNKLSGDARGYLFQPLVTVLMIALGWYAWCSIQERSFTAGFSAAFTDTESSKKARESEIKSIMEQANLRNTARVTALLENAQRRWLGNAVGAARVRLSVIHNGTYGVTGIALMHFDTISGVAAAGYAVGPLVVNGSLAEWAQFMPDLTSGRCAFIKSEQRTSISARERISGMSISAVMACPVTDGYDRLIGALFMSWPLGVTLPADGELARLKATGHDSGREVAAILAATMAD